MPRCPPMAPRQKRWSSVRFHQGPCLFCFCLPHWASRLPHAACLLAHAHLSCSFQARRALAVRPWPQDRGRIHRDSTRHVLPESGRGARSRRGLNSWRTVAFCLLFSPSVDRPFPICHLSAMAQAPVGQQIHPPGRGLACHPVACPRWGPSRPSEALCINRLSPPRHPFSRSRPTISSTTTPSRPVVALGSPLRNKSSSIVICPLLAGQP
jgi:hypothetical protein